MSARGYSPAALDYFAARAINPKVAESIGVREANGSIVFPYGAFERTRSLNGNAPARTLQPSGEPLVTWWPVGRCGGDAALLCEGESDALAAISALSGPLPVEHVRDLPVVAIPGTGYPVGRLVGDLAEAGVTQVWLALDGDTAGRRYVERAAPALKAAGVQPFLIDLPDDRDLADCLAAAEDEGEWIANAIFEAEAAAEPPPSLHPVPDRSTPADDWPTLGAPALYGLAGEVVRTLEPHTEADPVAILAQLLTAFGNACGRGPGFWVGGDFHATNLFVALVGGTGSGRKGASWGMVRRVMDEVDPEWLKACVASGLSSGEGIVHAVRDPVVVHRRPKNKDERERADDNGYIEDEQDPGVEDKRLLAYQGEFAQVLRAMGREGNTLSAIIRDLWDRGNARTLTKNSPGKTTGALLSIIAHVTPRELRAELAESEQANGFANRFLFLSVRRSKLLPFGGEVPPGDWQRLGSKLRDALVFARDTRAVDLDAEAREDLVTLYPELTTHPDNLFGAVTGRAEAQVRRLAVLYALLDQSPIVRRPHLHAAVAVWDYAEASAARVFGETIGDQLADKLRAALVKAGSEGLTRSEIRHLVGGKEPAERIEEALNRLRVRGLAAEQHEETAGRPAQRWRTLEGVGKPRAVEETKPSLHPTPLPSTFPGPGERWATADEEALIERLGGGAS
jgi:hypothetical protein